MRDFKKSPIAVFFPGALGDFICLLPAIHALGKEAQVDIFAKAEFAEIVSQNFQIRTLECYEINRLFVVGGASEPRVRDFFSTYKRIYSWMASGQPVFAGELAAAAPGRARLFAFRGPNPATHQAEYYLSCLGLSIDREQGAGIPLRSDALRWSEEFCNRHALNNKSVLILSPGSGAREKNWPVEYFATVARWWRKRTCGEVIVLLGPVEEERRGFDLLVDEFIPARNLRLAQVAALLCRGDVYLGNDSGITHLAAFLGRPTVAVFGPSEAMRWAPRGPKVLLLSRGVACSPCKTDEIKRCPHRKCLTGFFPERVIEELEKFDKVATLTR